MIDQLTLVLATPIAKAVLEKFYEGVGSQLGKKAVDLLPAQAKHMVQRLGQLVWDRGLRNQPDTEKLLQGAAQGTSEDWETLKSQVSHVLESDATLKHEAQTIAESIYQTIQIDGISAKNSMQVFGGQGEQFNTENVNAPTIQGGSGHNISITYNNPPSSD